MGCLASRWALGWGVWLGGALLGGGFGFKLSIWFRVRGPLWGGMFGSNVFRSGVSGIEVQFCVGCLGRNVFNQSGRSFLKCCLYLAYSILYS